MAVLGDEFDRSGQGLEVVDGLAVEILGDGDGLVHVAQAHLSGLLFHHRGLCCRRADRLCVGHQVHEGVAACGCGAASRFNVLFVLEARRAPVAVQVHESGQHGQSSGVQHRFVFSGQCGQVLTDGGDLSVLYIQLHRPALGVDSVDEQHKITSLSVFVWFHRPGVSALRRAKKKLFPAKGKVNTSKKETLEPQQKRLQTDFSVLHASSWPSCSRLLFYPFFFDIFYHRSAKCVNAFGLISM